jgi:hypothetical protein
MNQLKTKYPRIASRPDSHEVSVECTSSLPKKARYYPVQHENDITVD